MGTTDLSKIGKGNARAVYHHSAYLIYMDYIMQNPGLMNHKFELRLPEKYQQLHIGR